MLIELASLRRWGTFPKRLTSRTDDVVQPFCLKKTREHMHSARAHLSLEALHGSGALWSSPGVCRRHQARGLLDCGVGLVVHGGVVDHLYEVVGKPPKFEGDINVWNQRRFQTMAYFGALDLELYGDLELAESLLGAISFGT